MRERTRLDKRISGYDRLTAELEENAELIAMAEAEGDDEIAAEAEAVLKVLNRQAEKQQIESLLSGEADGNDCYLEVHAGAGGTESQDWAEMLLRMYLRWGEDHNMHAKVIELSQGEVAGIKSATIHYAAPYAYGWLRSETGVHRLVRKSPFDSGNRRHTSFASVFVSPEIDEDIDIELNLSDCRIDTYRSSGAGGMRRPSPKPPPPSPNYSAAST